MSGEKWLPVPDAPDYEVSDMGRVRSIERTVYYEDGRVRKYPSVVLTQATTLTGYKTAMLRVDKSPKLARVHALVLEAFVEPRPEGMIGLHTNGDPADNRLGNLRWGTHAENSQDMLKHGRSVNATKTHCIHGHEYDAANTYVSPVNGSRSCRKCLNARAKKYKARLRLGISGVPNGQRTECPKGHPLIGENVYVQPRRGAGGRRCKQCHRDRERARDATMRAARKEGGKAA